MRRVSIGCQRIMGSKSDSGFLGGYLMIELWRFAPPGTAPLRQVARARGQAAPPALRSPSCAASSSRSRLQLAFG
jgi:hypothetical protein